MTHTELLERAVKLAKKGAGYVEPNPRVGALVVKDGTVVGEGWHESWGGAHAEVRALAAAGEKARGADLWVTLEPCSTQGKTDACTHAILATGIRRVFFASNDPSRQNGGKARSILEAAGIEVVKVDPTPACEELIAPFTQYANRTLPWTVLKWAMSADGKVATTSGDARWISCEDSRREGHEERARADAVIVGRATVKADDPELTVRMGVKGRNPVRVIFDTGLHIGIESKVVQSAAMAPTWVLHAPDVDARRKPALEALGVKLVEVPKGPSGRIDPVLALRLLREAGLHRILVEGGPTIHGALLDARCADWIRVYMAPVLLGGVLAPGPVAGMGVPTLEDAVVMSDCHVRVVGAHDFCLEGRVARHREA